MKKHERLLDDYEDALFALLLEPVAEQESTEALELKVHLKDDPAAAVPAEVTRSSLRTIHQEFARQRRKHIIKTAKRALNHVAYFCWQVPSVSRRLTPLCPRSVSKH